MNILGWFGLERKKERRGRGKKIDTINRRKIISDLYFDDGLRQSDIAKELDISIKTVERDVKVLKTNIQLSKVASRLPPLKKRNLVFKDITKEQTKEIRRLVKEGSRYEDIAKIMGTTKGVIGYIINKKRSHRRYTNRRYIKEHREDILRRAHDRKTPEHYHEHCPACNKTSHLTIEQWVELQKYVRVSRLQNKEFSLSAFTQKHQIIIPAKSEGNKWGITPESALRVLDAPDGIREFVPVTRNEVLQREPEKKKKPKGGFVLSDDY